MASFISIFKSKKLTLFLNISFFFLILFYITSSFHDQPEKAPELHRRYFTESGGCTGIHDYSDYESKCAYVKSYADCQPKGYINYLEIFYCNCGQSPILGHFLLFLCLLVLFYLLGNTAADYFCSSLESLSEILKLSPTIAGVTLLSLGNGAPDVLASIISFTRSSNGDFGLNSILGGDFFVSSAVVGIISLLISPQEISVDKSSFIRDVFFLLFSLCSLLLIIAIGKVTLWASIAFLSIYLVYVLVVCFMHFNSNKQQKVQNFVTADDFLEMGIPLLGYVDDEKPNLPDKTSSNIEKQKQSPHLFCNFDPIFGRILYILELPLSLPRRLTIPVISEEKWSKGFAVTSVTLAPILLAQLYNTQMAKKMGSRSSLVATMTAGLIGIVLGNLAFVTTKKSNPPKKCQFPWLAAGFLMSVTWTYIIAEELVSLLLSIGYIFGISPSILGLTVLAWGNSLGDLIANVAMAINGGPNGVQIAISGCYAGPVFNTLMGLGVSLVFSSWEKYPSSYEIPNDPSLYETLGFLMGGLVWAIVILPRKKMRLDKFLGIGLLAIYLCFLSLRLAKALGMLNLPGDYSFSIS